MKTKILARILLILVVISAALAVVSIENLKAEINSWQNYALELQARNDDLIEANTYFRNRLVEQAVATIFWEGEADRWEMLYEYELAINRPKVIETVIYRYPNSEPYEKFTEPLTYEQAKALLGGFRASHAQWLNVTFEEDPGYGIGDKELQAQFVEWYDNLIFFVDGQQRLISARCK